MSKYNFRIDYRQSKKNSTNALFRRSNLMQKNDDVFEKNRRILHRFQKILQLRDSNIKIMFITCKFQKKTERSKSFEIHTKSIANQQEIDWRTLVIDETYVIERFDELIAMRNVMISKQIYDEKIAKFLVDLIFQMLFQNLFVVLFRKRLIIFNENDERWTDENDVFRFEKKLYVLNRIRFDILQRCHDDFFANHFEMNKILKLFRRKYYWFDRNYDFDMFVDMFEFVKKYCENCAICKRNKTSKHKSYEKFQFLFVSQYRWADFTMNFVTKLSTNKNWNDIKYDNIFVVVDRFAKIIHYIFVTKTIKIKNLTKMFIRKIIRYHDFFNSIIIDRESLFTFEYFFFVLRIENKKKTFIAFHFQIDEQTKRQNNIMKQYFRTYVNFVQNNWIFLFFMIEFVYNNANHVSIDMSSFKINLSYNFRMIFEKNFDSRSRASTTLNQSKKLRQLIVVFKDELMNV